MESDILVEGFNSSIEAHGLKYTKVIGDGDSSVYFQLRRNVAYGSSIFKIECLKNYKTALYKVTKV